MNRALLAGSVTLGAALLPVCLVMSGVPLIAAQAPAVPVPAAVAQVAAGPDTQSQAEGTTAAKTTAKSAGTDTIIVRLSSRNANAVKTATAAVRAAAAGVTGVKAARLIGTDIVSVTLKARVSADVATKLAKATATHAGVEAADRSLTFEPASTGSSTIEDYQWNLAGGYGVNAGGAWGTTTGMDASGKTVVVGVVDTGIASNAALPATTTTHVTSANGKQVVGTTAAGLPVVVTNAGGQKLCSTTADSTGAFRCTPLDPRPADEDVITVTATDQVGRTSIGKWVVGDSSTVTPTMKPSNGSRIDGTAEVGATIALTYHHDGADVVETKTVTAGSDGTWTVVPSTPLSDGDTVTAVATDQAGNVSSPATLTIDKVAPDAPVLKPTQGTVVKGTKEAGSFVTITWTSNSGDPQTRTLEADPATTWEVELDPSAKDGTTISATATDPSGNVSDPGTTKADRTPPATPHVAPSDGHTVHISGVETGATPSMVDDNGDTVAGSWANAGSGNWTFTPSHRLAESDSVFVVLTDEAGNASAPVPVVVDTTAPDKPVVNPTSGRLISGSAEPLSTITITYMRRGTQIRVTTTAGDDGTWTTSLSPAASNGRTITVTATDAAGNVSAPTTVTVDATPPSAPAVSPSNGHTVSITGVEDGATPSLVGADDSTVDGTWTDAGDGTWTFVPTEPLTEDAAVSVVLTDAADNTSVPVPVTIDTTAPAAPTIDTVTSAQVSGTAEAGSAVTVTYRDADGTEHTTDPVIADGGTWALALDPAAAPGTELTAKAKDAVGNTSEAATAQVPDAPSTEPSDPTSPSPSPSGESQQVVGAANAAEGPSISETTVDNGTNMVGTVLPGYDFVDGGEPTDTAAKSHGTHVSGIIAATGVGLSPAGVAPAVQIEPLRALDSNATVDSPNNMQNVIDAISWGAGISYGTRAVNPYPVDVLNLSIATDPEVGATCPDTLQSAINAAVEKGVVVVVAAGNKSTSIATTVPANCHNVIVVTASTAGGERADYSNWGTSATSSAWLVAAPGGSGDLSYCDDYATLARCTGAVVSTVTTSVEAKTGTSMAAPHVAAVAALLKSVNRSLTPSHIAQIIRARVTPMSDGCPTAVCGSGIVNAAAAVAAARDNTSVTAADGVSATVSAAVTGTRQVGAVLTAGPTSSATAYTTPNSYQWLRGDGVTDVAIPGETSSSYRITGADYGKYISVRVTTALGGATAIVGKASVWTRGYLAPLNKPVATGKKYKVKYTLKATIGTWSPAPSTVTYQWYRSGKKIKKATKATYKLTKSDRGKTVKVKVTVSAVGYYVTYAYSASHKIKR